jgi:hypothetical protein
VENAVCSITSFVCTERLYPLSYHAKNKNYLLAFQINLYTMFLINNINSYSRFVSAIKVCSIKNNPFGTFVCSDC